MTGNKKILVAEYFQSGTNGTGDPSLVLAMPTDAYLEEYLFFAPPNWSESWINVVYDKNTSIELDGNTNITAQNADGQIGVSDWRVRRVKLNNAGDGTHVMKLNGVGMPYGVSVYGYDANNCGGVCASYWYPGGLNLPTP